MIVGPAVDHLADCLPITAAKAMLRHALTSTTLNIHAHVLPGAVSRPKRWSASWVS
jgi:hypothetical protein